MQRKTAREVLSTGDSDEIHSWLRTATLEELRDALEAVKRHETWGSHVRDALDILIATNSERTAKRVLFLTYVAGICGVMAVICGAIQAFGVFWMICHTH
jgi:hypothetical protein